MIIILLDERVKRALSSNLRNNGKKSKRECGTAVATESINRCKRKFFGSKSRSSKSVGKIGLTVSKWLKNHLKYLIKNGMARTAYYF